MRQAVEGIVTSLAQTGPIAASAICFIFPHAAK